MKVDSKNLNQGLNKLFVQIIDKVQKGAYVAFQEEYNDAIPKHTKKVTGSFANSFQPMNFIPNKSSTGLKGTISVFGNGVAARLNEYGAKDPKFNAGIPKFITYAESPGLLAWAETLGIRDKLPKNGVYVGKKGTTMWGSSSNKWFTKSSGDVKSNVNNRLKIKIRNELDKINK